MGKDFWNGVGALVFLGVAAAYCSNGSSGGGGKAETRQAAPPPPLENPKPPLPVILEAREKRAERQKQQAAEDAKLVGGGNDVACRRELQCWGDRNLLRAAVACQGEIERLANFDFEWTDGWLEPKFSKMAWTDRNAGTITYWGDKIRFQNGFGAWQTVSYKCIFNTATNRMVAVEAWPGRL